MRFDDRFIDELKTRLRPSDVIGKAVKLKRQGREFVGLSPFSKEKSPSFFVNDDKGFFHDFSSGKHGDIISFLQETERLSFVEAIERLAGEAGMALPEPDARSAQQEKVRSGLTDWMDLAAKWFESELRRPLGQDARAYLERRGLPSSEWERFHIGLAPANRTGLKDYLVAKGARPGELVEAGLLIAPEDGGAPYDRFRDRIIFPITDARGRIVSFGGRALDPNARAKYLNGPDTVLFDKGRTLYGLFEARKILHSAPASEQGELVVVEGYMDVIACHRAGIAAAAPMGTALTEGQMELLWRLHPEPTLCFDGDAAGRRAAARTVERALPILRPGHSFKFASISGGKDPDEVLREQGEGALRDQFKKTTSFVDAVFQKEVQSGADDTPDGLASLKGRLRSAAALIQDKDLSDQYKIFLNDLFDRQYPSNYYGKTKLRKKDSSVSDLINKNAAAILNRRLRRFNAALIAGALSNPNWIEPFVDEFALHGFGDERADGLVDPFVKCIVEYNSDPAILAKLIHEYDVHGLVVRVSAISYEIDGPPFFDERLEDKLRGPAWAACYSTIIEIAALESELKSNNLRSALDSSPDNTSLRGTFAGRRQARDRLIILKKAVSDLQWDFWGAYGFKQAKT